MLQNQPTPEQQQKIDAVREYLRGSSVYLRSPQVTSALEPTGEYRRTLRVYLDQDNTPAAWTMQGLVEDVLAGPIYDFSNEQRGFIAKMDLDDPETKALIESTRREYPELRAVPDRAVTFFPQFQQYTPHAGTFDFLINKECERFELLFQHELGVIIEPTLDELRAYAAELEKEREGIIADLGGREFIPESEARVLFEKQPELGEKYDGFLCDGYFIDPTGELLKPGEMHKRNMPEWERELCEKATVVLPTDYYVNHLSGRYSFDDIWMRSRWQLESRFSYKVQWQPTVSY